MLLGVVVLIFVGGVNGGGDLRFPRGHVFSPSPVLLQLVHSLKTRHHPSPPCLHPSCLLAPQLEVHLLCLISPLAIGYVYHQCTIFVAEVCMPHLGKAYQFQMGLSEKGIHGFGSLSSQCHWDRTLESNYSANWHLLIPLSAKSPHPPTPPPPTFWDAPTKRGGKNMSTFWFGATISAPHKTTQGAKTLI